MAPARAAVSPDQEGAFSIGSSHTPDQLDTCFHDTHAVANAGLLLPATLAERLGIEQAADQVIDLGRRAGAHRPGRKLLTLVHAMLAGADCIDDADLLRCGATSRVLGHRVMAPSTIGTFLRAFTFGHVRQLDRLTEQLLTRAWAAGAGPGDGPMTMDLDSTVCEVHGDHKQGAAYGYTHTLGYHPLLASRADRGEVLHARQRTGRANTARGTARFVDEPAARVRRAGASGELTTRMDSGFWSAKTIRACRRHQIRYSITVRQTKPIRAAIATIPEDAWTDIVYPDGGLAQVAETRYQGDRLLVRHTRLIGAQAELFPDWRCHAFVTDRVGTTVWLDQDHRRHAVVELCSATSRAGWACDTARRASSTPTPPGWWRPPWHTTCCAGSPPSGWASAASWWWPRPCAAPCSACPAASPAPPAAWSCTCPPAGRGHHGLSWPWRDCAASPTPPDPPLPHRASSQARPSQQEPASESQASSSRLPILSNRLPRRPGYPPAHPTTVLNPAPQALQPARNSGVGGSRLRPSNRPGTRRYYSGCNIWVLIWAALAGLVPVSQFL
jgi:Transposase DDE domain group 1